jgi:hypothetical protein
MCSSFYFFAVVELKIMSQPPVGSFAANVGLNGVGTVQSKCCMSYDSLAFTAAIVKIVLLWAVTTCSIVGGYRHFGGACCFCLQGWNVCVQELALLYSHGGRKWSWYRRERRMKGVTVSSCYVVPHGWIVVAEAAEAAYNNNNNNNNNKY